MSEIVSFYDWREGALLVRVVLGEDTYTRHIRWSNDDDYRDLVTAQAFMRHADMVNRFAAPDLAGPAVRVDHARAIEVLFPALHHDPRLPA